MVAVVVVHTSSYYWYALRLLLLLLLLLVMVTSTVSVLAPMAMVIALLVGLARDIMVPRVVGMTVRVAKCDYYYY